VKTVVGVDAVAKRGGRRFESRGVAKSAALFSLIGLHDQQWHRNGAAY
jgi:hypothetical protein